MQTIANLKHTLYKIIMNTNNERSESPNRNDLHLHFTHTLLSVVFLWSSYNIIYAATKCGDQISADLMRMQISLSCSKSTTQFNSKRSQVKSIIIRGRILYCLHCNSFCSPPHPLSWTNRATGTAFVSGQPGTTVNIPLLVCLDWGQM